MGAGFKAAGRTAVAGQGLGGVVQRLLHGGMVLLFGQGLAFQPLGGSHQGRLMLQVLHQELAAGGSCISAFLIDCDQCLQQIQRGCLLIVLEQQIASLGERARCLGHFHKQAGRQGQGCGAVLCQGLKT